jgi:hypothetical protein
MAHEGLIPIFFGNPAFVSNNSLIFWIIKEVGKCTFIPLPVGYQ